MALFYPHPYKGETGATRNAKDDPGLPDWPWRACIVGPPGSGKRSATCAILDRLTHWPDRVIVVHLDPDASGAKEYSFADEWVAPDDLPDFEDIELTDGRQPRTVVILDEIPWGAVSKATIAKMRTLFNFVSTHRNCSIILQSQNYCAIPENIRSACNWLILTGKTVNPLTLGVIGTRIGCERGEIAELQELLRSPYDSLSAQVGKDPADRWTLNLTTPIRLRCR